MCLGGTCAASLLSLERKCIAVSQTIRCQYWIGNVAKEARHISLHECCRRISHHFGCGRSRRLSKQVSALIYHAAVFAVQSGTWRKSTTQPQKKDKAVCCRNVRRDDANAGGVSLFPPTSPPRLNTPNACPILLTSPQVTLPISSCLTDSIS